MGRHKDLLLMWFIGLYFSAECQQQNLRCICLCSCIKVFITDAAQGFLCITKHLQTKAHMSKSSRGTMEGWLQRWLWGVSFGLCCSREAMANSRTQNLVQNRQKYSKSHKMKQRDRTDQDKEKNELSRLVLIMACSREKWTSLCQGNFTGCCKGGYEMTLTVCVRTQERVMHLEQHCKQSFAGNHFVLLQR